MERCHFWLGRFHNQADVDAYLAETVPYPEDGPISKFAAEQGKCFYDHDFVFAEFSEAGDIAAILTTIRAPPGTREAVLAAAGHLPGRIEDWLELARRGLFGFDWQHWSGPYLRAATPSVAVGVADLPAELQRLVRLVELPGVRFVELGSVRPEELCPCG